jgi:dihydrofolate synthase/folylpolyglutamate synthase
MQKFTRYYEAVAYLEGLSNLPIRGDYITDRSNLSLYLKRMRYFLSLLGNPDEGMKFVHITGTAGKGSVTNMLHEVLHASGKNVGSFTSPFITTSIEKIRVGELYISPDEFTDILEDLKPHIDYAYVYGPYGRPSYFEIYEAIAFIYFRRMKCEWIVLEVGCGGRYDATNVIKNPVITAITNIDYDHRELIGDTLAKIAYEKAGIIKKGSVFFTSEQRPVLQKFFKKVCKNEGAAFNLIPHQESYREYNTALVTRIAETLEIKPQYIREGIKRSFLQCRFEIMQKNPTIVLDGAHNRVKVASTISNLQRLKYRKLILIIGMAENKEHLSMLSQVVPLGDQIYFTRFKLRDRLCAHPTEIFKKSKKYLKKTAETEITLDAYDALEKALGKARKNDLILVVGSFYLAGELRKKWYPEEFILEKRKCI